FVLIRPVPAELSVLAWDDSMLCRVVRPAVTAFAHGVAKDAATAARMLLELVETGAVEEGELSSRRLVPRASTAAPGS
ncbi:substrate-binding domain-containing protein, partial [Saccharopolyspora kobensis]|uniref:substrate-binding domain-containing protein n=1 Tax=Saccharopolyspora kobensis TaxID=146035 RepID=UPI00331CCF13